jgi:site-specific recombinase XerD
VDDRRSTSASTARAYAADWRDFDAWCERHGFRALPGAAETVALYLRSLDEAGRKLSTLRRRLAAIAHRHSAAGLPSPTDDALIREVLDEIGEVQELASSGKAPLLTSDLRRMLAVLPASLAGLRDRSLLLTGFAGGLRRSELVALDVDDLDRDDAGIVLVIPARRRERRVRLLSRPAPDACPVRALDAWLSAAEIARGPLFRSINRHGQVGDSRLSDRAVALVVKRAAEGAGLDPRRYAAQSLRSGAAISRRLEAG